MMMQIIAISLLDLSILTVILRQQVIMLLTGVIKINSNNIQHCSNRILESKPFMSTTHILFYVSASCLESENEVLKHYVSSLPLQR